MLGYLLELSPILVLFISSINCLICLRCVDIQAAIKPHNEQCRNPIISTKLNLTLEADDQDRTEDKENEIAYEECPDVTHVCAMGHAKTTGIVGTIEFFARGCVRKRTPQKKGHICENKDSINDLEILTKELELFNIDFPGRVCYCAENHCVAESCDGWMIRWSNHEVCVAWIYLGGSIALTLGIISLLLLCCCCAPCCCPCDT